ncbi:MAG: sugar phosphate nucleotidyltransferase [Deltaproteobacteria bacterium]
MKVVIMAGGEGTRLRPLTCNIPKPMVPIMNKPIMQHIIELLKKTNLTDIAVTLQYMPEIIRSYFENGSQFGVSLKYYIEQYPLGTAGSVKNAQDFLDDTFIVISGDALTDIDLNKAIEFHKANKSIATLVLTKVKVPLEYGVVVTDNDGRITRFLEKPSWGEVFSDTVNTGIYILQPDILEMIKKDEIFDFSKDLFPYILKNKLPIYGYITENYWCDIGDLRAYYQAHLDIFEKKVNIDIEGIKSEGQIWIGEDCEIDDGSQINGPVVIGKNVKIKKGTIIDSFSVIGNNSIFEENSYVKRSIIWKNCFVGSNARLNGTIISNKVQVMEGNIINENSVIGNGTTIKQHAIIGNNVKIWPNKIIDSGVEINTNLVWGNTYSKSLFGTRGIKGQINLEITPEFASKLAGAFGANFKKYSKIGISHDGKPASQMLFYSMISGLLSAGLEVYSFDKMILPMTRNAVKFYRLNGGIYITSIINGNGKLQIDFLDSQGANISKSLERSIENAFVREDFSRCDAKDINKITNIYNFNSFYTRNILNNVKSKSINLKVLLNCESEFIQEIIKSMITELGCKVECTNLRILDNKKDSNNSLNEEISYLSNYVRLSGCDMGVYIDNNCEKLHLIDDTGKIINDDLFLAVATLILFKKYKGSTAVVPISASNVMEEIAHKYNGKILRTKTSVQDIMRNLNLNSSQEVIEEQFAYYFDALSSLVKILDFLESNKLKLSDLVDTVPEFYINRKIVDCSWDMKGKVIRSISEEKNARSKEMIEGVKIHKDNGWVLILPDAEEPVCSIIGESINEEFAEELTDFYANKIREIEKE